MILLKNKNKKCDLDLLIQKTAPSTWPNSSQSLRTCSPLHSLVMHRCQVTGSVRFQVPLKAHLLTISYSVSARRYRESCAAFSISNLTSTCTLSYCINLLQEGYKQTSWRTSYCQFFHGSVCPSLQLCRRGSWGNLQSKITRHQMENVFQAYSPIAPTHSTALEYQRASEIGWKFIVRKRALYLDPCISPQSF